MSGRGGRYALGSRHERVHADVCVIGAGIAGLIAATRIAARSRCRVVIVESGTSTAIDTDAAMVSLDTVHAPGGTYHGTARGRGIGGTSAKWAGKLLPLSPHDHGARPYLNLEAWPIDAATLSQYTPEIETLMAVDGGSYEHGLDDALDPQGRLPIAMDEIVWRWPKRPTRANHRIDHVLRDELRRLSNLEIWTDATVTALNANEGRLGAATATNHRAGKLVIEAEHFVIAAGTLESTRLLLLADAQNDGCISRTTDSLGRYFNDHFGIEVATVQPVDMMPVNRALADRKVRGTMRHLHGELSPQRQQMAAVASAYFDFDAAFGPHSLTSHARAAVAGLRDRDVPTALRHLSEVLVRPGELGRALTWRALQGQQLWPANAAINAKIWIEQLPVRANRLRLADRQDALGVPMLHVDLEKTDIDEHTFQAMIDSLDQFWTRHMANAATLDWNARARSERAVDAASEQAHPAGSTRMGRDARRSVVDPSLRVHALDNVQVASASVFPSSGSANPTLTIMQLAMLAADMLLAQRLKGDSAAITSPSSLA